MLQGSMVALVTPMKRTGEIDYPALDRLIDWHIESGTHAIVFLGTTGESATVSSEERAQFIPAAISKVNKRIPVIVGAGTNCTKTTIAQTQHAQEQGADAVLLVTPYYNRPTQEGLYQHYKAVAEAVDIPQVLYNVPFRTGCDLLPSTVLRLAEFKNIVALKETVNDPVRWQTIIEQTKLALFSGSDAEALDLLKAGGRGVISVVANVVPRLFAQMCLYALNRDFEHAEILDRQMHELYEALFLETNPIPTKWALHKMGKLEEGIRLPLTCLSSVYRLRVEEALK